MIYVILGASLLLNVVLVYHARMTERAADRFQQFVKQTEHNRRRVADALAVRFQYLAKAHKQDHDKLEPMSKVVSRQGEAVRMMRSGFHGLTTAYSDAANDVLYYLVGERDPQELLKETAEREL